MAFLQKKNQGYGICGAKNVYSSATRLGNWTEDVAGKEISSGPRRGDRLFETEYMGTISRNRSRDALPQSETAVMNEIVTVKAAESLPYSLLFEHSNDLQAEDRFKTSKMIDTIKSGHSIPNGILTREKYKEKLRKMRKELSLAQDKTTEARFANRYINSSEALVIPRAAIGRSEDLPMWTRRSVLQYEKEGGDLT